MHLGVCVCVCVCVWEGGSIDQCLPMLLAHANMVSVDPKVISLSTLSDQKNLNPLLHRETDIENIVGKEEIARNEQFLLFP